MTKVFWIFLSNEAQIIREQKNKNKKKTVGLNFQASILLLKQRLWFLHYSLFNFFVIQALAIKISSSVLNASIFLSFTMFMLDN